MRKDELSLKLLAAFIKRRWIVLAVTFRESNELTKSVDYGRKYSQTRNYKMQNC